MGIKRKIKEGLLSLLIRLAERELAEVPYEALNEKAAEGLLASLWSNAAFRNYVKSRDAKLIYSIAGTAGSEPEPRDKARLVMGQRVEILILFAKAKAAAARIEKERALKKEPKNA